MCGIAGVVSLDGAPVPVGVVERMTATLEHRGPDDLGHWYSERCALGHRRLTIIDLSRNGRQPLSNADDTTWIAHNGEVYNYLALREQLAGRGHTFRSRTDTEVVVHLYDEEGLDFLHQLDGMFAFAVWDTKRRRLLLARDRLGIKPLCYARASGLLLFASEAKAILASGLVQTAPNIDAIVSYLGYRHPVWPSTMFDGIELLPAGHYLVAEDGEVTTSRYWDLDVPEEREDRGEAFYIEQTRDLLKQAVHKRLMSDVPLGAYLSGGLDSSVVVALMAEEMGDRLKTYSIGFDDDEASELPFARLVAERYRTDHTEIRLDANRYLDLLPELIHKRDAPLAVPNEVPLYEMSHVLKQDITVVLSGEGADEIFAGYGDYWRIPFDLHKARVLSAIPELLRRPLLGGLDGKYDGRMAFAGELDHFLTGYKWFGPDERLDLLTREAREQVRGGGRDTFEAVFGRTAGLPYYDRVLYALEKVHLHNLLARVDSMTMATSVEGRVPFVDHTLVEAVTNMPLRYKLRWRSPFHQARAMLSYSDVFRERDDTTKYILRRAFADALPRRIVERRKVGFKVPLERWFRGDLIGFARDLLLSDEARRRGILDIDAVESWLERGPANGGEFGQKVWMLVNLELWFRLYFPDGGSLRVPTAEEAAVGAANGRRA
jgi:asparagine synthase (glutamine-hydrolysing)